MKKVEIYTDGACSGNPGPGGYAAMLIYRDNITEISGGEPHTTNNRMELTAPLKALEALKEPCVVTLYSDSTYLVNAFNNGWIYQWEKAGWRRGRDEVKNPDLFKRLLELSKIHDITWVHVKGHADNEYNNRCDALAVMRSVEEKEKLRESDPGRDIPYDGPLAEIVLDSERKFHGRVFDIEKRSVRLGNGSVHEREIVLHTGGAAIVAVDEDNNVCLVRQFRSAAQKIMLEIPAGKLEKGEDPKAAAIRELREETGLSADPDNVRLLASVYVTPAYCTEKIYIYFTRVKGAAGDPHRDADELLKCETAPFGDVLSDVCAGRCEDAKTSLGILLASKILGENR